MSPGAGVVSLGRGYIIHIMKMHYFFKNFLLYSHAYIRQNKYIVMMTKEVSTENVKFHKPRDRHSCAKVWPYNWYSENALFLIKSSFLPQIRQTMYIVKITREGSTKIVTFMPPGAGIIMLRWRYISHKVKMLYLIKNLLLYSEA